MNVSQLKAICEAAESEGFGQLPIIVREPGDRSAGIPDYEGEASSAGVIQDLNNKGQWTVSCFEIGCVS